MISDITLQRLCSPVVLRRAKRIAMTPGRISRRRCRFDEGETTLRARVDSTSSWDEAHRTTVVLDEDADSVTYYECNCHQSMRGKGPCDHVVAVVLDYNDAPERFEGYGQRDRPQTSRGVKRLIERAELDSQDLSVPAVTDGADATVRLEPTIAYEVGMTARFRIAGTQGSYALKSISDFVVACEHGSFVDYGKRLAFVHERSVFEPCSWRLVEFLVRAVQNRRAFVAQRIAQGLGRTSTMGQPQRELSLSAPEVWELLEACKDVGVLFEDRSATPVGEPGAHAMRIVDGDPAVRVDIVDAPQGCFELQRSAGVRLVSIGSRSLGWDAHTLYRCSPHLSRDVELLAPLLVDPNEHMVLSATDASAFCAQVLPRLEQSAELHASPRLDKFRPLACELRFYVDYQRSSGVVTCDARAAYADVELPLFGEPDEAADARGSKLVRDVRAEARGREVVRTLFTLRDGRLVARKRGEELGWLVFDGIARLQEVGSVYASTAFKRLRSASKPVVRVGLSVRSNLLDVTLKAEGVGADDVAGILTSYQSGRRFHRLRDGSIVDLHEADLQQAGEVLDELGLDGLALGDGMASVPAYQALSVDTLVADDDKDDSFRAFAKRLDDVSLGTFEPPASLRGVLRPYQLEGFRWLCSLAQLGLGGILADEMGLGKTLQLIAFVLGHASEKMQGAPTLVVCPSSLMYNWKAEFQKFAPELAVSVVAGTPDERRAIRCECDACVLITSYDLLRRDVDDYEGRELWCVVADEAQYIKNPVTQVAQAIKRLTAQHRVALTGTPVENRLSELWSIFDFLMPGLLGAYSRFRERYERPIVEEEDQTVAADLRRALRPFILRRAKRDVVADLPDKIEEMVHTRMGVEQRRLYDAQVQVVRDQMSADEDSFGRDKFQILTLITRLRQVCCDPRLLYEDYDGESCKTEAIVTLVRRVVDAGEKLLLFSQFTSYLRILCNELDRLGIAHYVITGDTPSSRRLDLVDAFNADDTPVFLISLKAGGTGLNLTGATVVVHADPWWNVAAQNQATDRAHRIGQTREVTVYKVVAADTIEERILELQRTKEELADAVVVGDVSTISLASLTREDLEALLG